MLNDFYGKSNKNPVCLSITNSFRFFGLLSSHIERLYQKSLCNLFLFIGVLH
jgi:hypothetical protein